MENVLDILDDGQYKGSHTCSISYGDCTLKVTFDPYFGTGAPDDYDDLDIQSVHLIEGNEEDLVAEFPSTDAPTSIIEKECWFNMDLWQS